ncbi:acyltransferase family protein [Actinoplanes awajinensis]|uniref:Acyltransferase 3 domain-containing protein n=1 Tax=Actinoplanes awajinensis subsp. mycoplanecinus TaxID=135947 RepID=A0A117MNZ6_9ACTN|nr:acyltransferase [Actinoplanes awajinensis]KUL27832.1 hypothetical protein ADL15_33905 [Actinoplanes awajinensis subsp. mycoplanecinus]
MLTAPDPRTSASATRGASLPSLTGLRWVAAFLVFAFHLQIVEFFAPGPAEQVLERLFASGSVGVSFFFILSGFVLMWSCARDGYRRFWWRRFARVYPLHLVTALLVVGYLSVHDWHAVPGPPALIANLALVQSWIPDVAFYQSVNTVSWTLSCEVFFYLLFPLIAAGVARLRSRGLILVAAGSWLVTAAGPGLARLVAGADAVELFFHWVPLGRLPEFVCGVALARLVRSAGAPRWRGLGRLAAVLTAGGYVLSAHVPGPWGVAACTMPGFALVLVAAARSDVRECWTPWRGRVMVRLGELSFAFYLVHLIVIRMFEGWFGYHPKLALGAGIGLTVSAFLLSLAAAWLLNVGVEGPARRLLLRRRSPAADAVPSGTPGPGKRATIPRGRREPEDHRRLPDQRGPGRQPAHRRASGPIVPPRQAAGPPRVAEPSGDRRADEAPGR